MPNIGKELEKRLNKVGIITPAQLKEAGSIKACQLLNAMRYDICINTLFALEGAIRNIRWHDLENNIKDELLFYFKGLEKRR